MPADQPPAIRHRYETLGVRGFYGAHGAQYRNPHEPALTRALAAAVAAWRPDLRRVLDLACGSGEAALALRSLGAGELIGADPFTAEAWRARTGLPCLAHDFAAVAAGALDGQRFTLAVCSFALHLCEPSRLPAVCWAMTRLCAEWWVATPHKRPQLDPRWGWACTDELLVERVRIRRHLAAPPAG